MPGRNGWVDSRKELTMTSLKRPALALSAAALMTLSLAACGSSGGGSDASSAPKTATVADFCAGIEGIGTAIDDKASSTDQADQAHTFADKLRGIGTPSDMPADARTGYEVFVDFLGKVSSSEVDKLKTASSQSSVFTGDDETKVTAFTTYATTACASVTPSTAP
jgi:hypothetical protein